MGDVPTYLRAYYRHVAADELTAAGPQRIAAVAGQLADTVVAVAFDGLRVRPPS